MGKKVIALRNFSGAKGMVLRGEIIELSEPYVTDLTIAGLVAVYVEAEPPKAPEKESFKTMKTKKK